MLYVSPLKALGNDIQKNLDAPLAEIFELAGRQIPGVQQIRTAVRTGDTLMPDRRAMVKRPPHILVTTPESLYILLTSASGRDMLSTVETVIVDEIHAVADDKRGAHLALSLERLDALAGRLVPRVGLSATVTPIDTIAAFLSGSGRPLPHWCRSSGGVSSIWRSRFRRSEIAAVATHEFWDEIYDRLAALVRAASLDAGVREHAGGWPSECATTSPRVLAKTPSPPTTAAFRGRRASRPSSA